jgi:hypothetical protein
MKPVKNLLSAMLLAAILAVTVFAGDLHGPGAVNPSPSPSPEGIVAYEETLPLDSSSNTGSLSTETSDSLFYEALAALLSVY